MVWTGRDEEGALHLVQSTSPDHHLDHAALRHLFANARDLFAVADYRRMWAIGAFCGVARWLEFVAIAIFAYELTHSPERVALLAVLRMLPYVLLGFGMGGWRSIEGIYALIAASYLVCLMLAARGSRPARARYRQREQRLPASDFCCLSATTECRELTSPSCPRWP